MALPGAAMEPAVLGVILNSSVVIEAERQHLNITQFLKHIAESIGESEAALSCITVAGVGHGIYGADTEERRASRRAFLDDLKSRRAGSDYRQYGGVDRQDQRGVGG
jgi:hypothetical protein